MANRSHSNLSIIEAVETLSNIADLEVDRGGVGVAQKHEIFLNNEKIAYKTVHWLHEQDASATVSLVKETFRVILHYLKQFYRKEYGYVTDLKTIEGIKTVMVLVGEAAKKLDKYTDAFYKTRHQSITELKEYKQLQDFYLSKIARKIDEGVLGRWILGLSLGKLPPTKVKIQLSKHVSVPEIKTEETKHVFIDLETVKKDTEYELFFLRKEDGTRFFSPRLIRNIKLVCDFGDYFSERKQSDPLENIAQWRDRVFHTSAKNILKLLGSKLDVFYHHLYRQSKEGEVVDSLSKALMALLLSSHSHNLMRNKPVKSCEEYFFDFLVFLRESIQARTYQKWITYPPKESNTVAIDTIHLIQTLCATLYSHLKGFEDMISIVHVLIQEANQNVSSEHKEKALESHQLWSQMAADYAAMSKLMKRHPNGPLYKVVNALENSTFHYFDPIMQHNLPSQLYDLYVQENRIENIRIANPIHQELINKASVNEEFKAFLRDYNQADTKKKHLLFNLQDRTAWREHARCTALENLQQQTDFRDALCVVTLATDTDFYHQLAPYHKVNHADTFIDQFKEHLKGEGSGFYFPSTINKQELSDFIDKSIKYIHRIFFSSKNVLLRDHRIDFIEIFYLFLQLKLIDMVKPTSFSLTCKDGLDMGMAYNVELFTLLKLLNVSHWSESDTDFVNFMIHAPTLIVRERVMLPERFNRMLSAIKTMESAQSEFGADEFSQIIQRDFAPLYQTPLLRAMLLLPS